jgi:hypothetical protein
MNIKSAQYYTDRGKKAGIIIIINELDEQEMSVPLDPANRHYAEILKQVKKGTLTIKDAD